MIIMGSRGTLSILWTNPVHTPDYRYYRFKSVFGYRLRALSSGSTHPTHTWTGLKSPFLPSPLRRKGIVYWLFHYHGPPTLIPLCPSSAGEHTQCCNPKLDPLWGWTLENFEITSLVVGTDLQWFCFHVLLHSYSLQIHYICPELISFACYLTLCNFNPFQIQL